MRIFVSWSQERSRAVASILHGFLPRIVQALEPWMSERDIDSGARWQQEIGDRLATTDVGICVVTRENVHRPWLNFEAGAISKSMRRSRLIPFRFDLAQSELSGPIAQFQGRGCTRDEVFAMLSDLNGMLDEKALSEVHLADTFERYWTSISDEFEKVRVDPKLRPAPDGIPQRSDRDVMEEILGLTRALHAAPRFLAGGSTMFFPLSAVGSGSVGTAAVDAGEREPHSVDGPASDPKE